MKIEFTYDWISATLPTAQSGQILKVLPLGELLENVKSPPKFGYNRCLRYETGAVIMWHDIREEMGVHVILSGSTLRALAVNGSDVVTVLAALRALGARVSRIDLAVDVRGSTLTLTDLCKPNRQPYKGKGRTPKYTAVGDVEDGWTIYIGSRSSDKFLRIYDKQKESGEDGDGWVRIEIECKGMVAHWLGDTLPHMTPIQAYDLASSLIKTMVDFNTPVWQSALSATQVSLAIPKKTERDTLAWLVNSCAPALARVIAEKPNVDVLGLFYDALKSELSRRSIEAI